MKNCLTPQNPIMYDTILIINLKCDPIIVNPVVKMQPQFSGISPLASYKEVHPPGVSHDEAKDLCQQELTWRYMYSQPGRNFISIKRGKDFLGHVFRE